MAHPLHHAESSARKYGGRPEDYQDLHDWMDASKAHFAPFTHRALRHHTVGIFEAERLFGPTLRNSAGRVIPTRWIGEQHVKEDCQGRIPSLADWVGRIAPAPWMGNGQIAADTPVVTEDPRLQWMEDVAWGSTLLGFHEWMEERAARSSQARTTRSDAGAGQ